MKHVRYSLPTLFVLILICVCIPSHAMAQGTSDLTIEVGVICKQVEERAPVDADTMFSASVGELFCFTKTTGAAEETTISHVWYWGEIERARLELPVRSISWRTYTTKRIQEHEVGAWRVDILDAQGTILKTVRFSISP
ncbi:DUF2914 domain-containing protein [Gemmatimonadota bacterium]